MTDCKKLTFINSVVRKIIILDPKIDIDNVSDFEVKIILQTDNNETKTYSIVGGEIQKVGNEFLLSIPDTSVTVAGIYDVEFLLTDQFGKRRITPCPNTWTFSA